jgi:hypothetical protein
MRLERALQSIRSQGSGVATVSIGLHTANSCSLPTKSRLERTLYAAHSANTPVLIIALTWCAITCILHLRVPTNHYKVTVVGSYVKTRQHECLANPEGMGLEVSRSRLINFRLHML